MAHKASLVRELSITCNTFKDRSHLLSVVALVRYLLLAAHLLRLGRSLEVVLDFWVLGHSHLISALHEILIHLLLLVAILLILITSVHLLRLVTPTSLIIALVLNLLLATRWCLRGHFLLTRLLHRCLPILGTHVLVKVVSSTHWLLLLRVVLVGTRAFSRSIEVAILKLMILYLSLRVEPSITFNYMVVCREG